MVSRTELSKTTENNPHENPPATNGRFRKMAALPRGERYFVIFAACLAWKMCESRHLAKPLVVSRKRRTAQRKMKTDKSYEWKDIDILQLDFFDSFCH